MVDSTHYIDFDEVIHRRIPNKKLSKPVFNLLKKLSHVDDINKLFAALPDKVDAEFMQGTVKYLNLKVSVYGLENLHSDDKPLIFASNHPLGALDAVTIGSVLGGIYGDNFKFYANEFLNELKPVRNMFLPIQKYGAQGRKNAQEVMDFFNSNEHLVTFPAGATSRKRKEGLQDLVWQKNFIQKSVEYKRDIVPLYFIGKNSSLFYIMQYIREFLKLKFNIEMLLLASEIFKQEGHHLKICIGKPIDWRTFDHSKKPIQWAKHVRDIAYKLPEYYGISRYSFT